ncbi:ABC transporter, periplasmic substrate-binding protein, putative [Shewanella halifaxensis HAW-EB4]|uniref:ABC transporter, periplasmic substrate-binding protein, putative n=1 Tax=Shewanella halifaxensis (strain HAW-EB4) TaxID=458817 RepID=B0TS03_SHEHH|nr:substrate-binding domain-containing protein [Shewanella halifaxensis]ABZ77915.1 ABC transporter, periplasmic substrate-binding protein, putative [Shewanella halifaxensis HAW-EB4]
MKLTLLAISLLAVTSFAQATDCKSVFGDGQQEFVLATGSPGELGMLEALADAFNADHNSRMCWVKAGSGKSLSLLKAGKIDMVMVHAPAAEKQAIKDGWATQHTLIGSNEFYLVGPVSDKGKVKGATSVAKAYSNIAVNQALFYTRGDNSGTHKKELSIWSSADVNPKGDWYQTTGDFMRASLKIANKNHGYFMTDSSTWVATQAQLPNLQILFKGDPVLINTYHALRSVDLTDPGVALSKSFIEFVASAEGQKIITDYGKAEYDQAMYDNAVVAAQYVH